MGFEPTNLPPPTMVWRGSALDRSATWAIAVELSKKGPTAPPENQDLECGTQIIGATKVQACKCTELWDKKTQCEQGLGS